MFIGRNFRLPDSNTKISAILRKFFTKGIGKFHECFVRINKSVKFNKLYPFRNLRKHERDLSCEFRKYICVHFVSVGKEKNKLYSVTDPRMYKLHDI